MRPVVKYAAVAVAAMGGMTALFALGAAQAQDATPPGRAVYLQYCSGCHDLPDEERAPKLASLQAMGEVAVRQALTEGVMKPMADPIPRPQLELLIAYLAPRPQAQAAPAAAAGRGGGRGPAVIDPIWVTGNMCAADKRKVDLAGPKTLVQAGVDKESTRRLTAAQAGVDNKGLADLEVAWTMGFPSTNNMGAQPVIVGSTLFYSSSTTRTVLALDTKTGCVKWSSTLEAAAPRTSLIFGNLGVGGPPALILGDGQGFIVTLNPLDGKVIWRADAKREPRSPVRAAPILFKDMIIVANSNYDVGGAAQANVECCKGHGAVVALSAKDGHRLWVWNTMEDAKALGRKNSAGVEMWGPSGAPIWSNLTIDEKRNVVYTTTGENNSPPATGTSDAIVAIDLVTGKEKWVFQGVARDIWSQACPSGVRPNAVRGPNCPSPDESVLGDYDFGAQAILFKDGKGKDLVLGGQKSGHVWALDADTGKLVWSHRFGMGTSLGGVHWGIATDGVRLFAPIADPYPQAGPPDPGMNAIDIRTGKVAWRWASKPDCGDGRAARLAACETKYGLSAAPMVVDKAVLSGSLDGKLWVFNAADGKVLASYDTARSFDTVNKVTAAGGAIDSQAVVAGDGMVFVGSGYGSFNQKGGNVLIAYRPKAR